jgi:hypothetical protein
MQFFPDTGSDQKVDFVMIVDACDEQNSEHCNDQFDHHLVERFNSSFPKHIRAHVVRAQPHVDAGYWR